MKIGSFDIDLQPGFMDPFDIVMKILNTHGGLYFLELCKDFNPFDWSMDFLFGQLFADSDNVIRMKLDKECVNALIEMRDESMSESDVYDYVTFLETAEIAKLDESNKFMIDPKEQNKIDLYTVTFQGKTSICAFYSKTPQARLINRAKMYTLLFEIANVNSPGMLKEFTELIKRSYQNFFNTDIDPFIIKEDENFIFNDDEWGYDEINTNIVSLNYRKNKK